jgi:hypothetical protein
MTVRSSYAAVIGLSVRCAEPEARSLAKPNVLWFLSAWLLTPFILSVLLYVLFSVGASVPIAIS